MVGGLKFESVFFLQRWFWNIFVFKSFEYNIRRGRQRRPQSKSSISVDMRCVSRQMLGFAVVIINRELCVFRLKSLDFPVFSETKCSHLLANWYFSMRSSLAPSPDIIFKGFQDKNVSKSSLQKKTTNDYPSVALRNFIGKAPHITAS